ncbi:hypothetical protein AURDEDRAFT_168953 [Auricularia subglabra TFB-10046 SS5]|nr:hypothetical protein AURDEDRAFT_168953 [Auricularia subglabra TFB-10046 SS5]
MKTEHPSHGPVGHSTTTATSPGPCNSNGAGTSPGDQNGGGDAPQSVGHCNTGAIVGDVVVVVLAGLALAGLAIFLFLRHRRQGRARTGLHEHQELLSQPWAPGRPQGPPPPSGQHGQNTTSFYNATSYTPASCATPASSHGSIHRSTGSRGDGMLHDEDVEHIAGRLAQLVLPVNSKAHYIAREPPASRRDEDESPPAY